MSPNKPRAPYNTKACAWCRHKRVRCRGEPPICQTCKAAGRASQCSWGPEPLKQRASNADYVKSLLKYVAILEKQLEQCHKEHGGLNNDYLHFRPNPPDHEQPLDLALSSSEGDFGEQMRTFRLEGQVLNFYGRTSVFRFAPRVPRHLSRFPEIAQDSSRSYVLLVDDVDMSNFNPNFDWSRHLPQEVHLERREHDKLLDLLFKFFTSWCLRVVPELFLRDMCRALSLPPSQPPPKTAHYSPMLHNALIALAAAFSDEPGIRDLKFRQYFARRAKSYIDAECREPDISVMHALSILGSYHSSLGEQTLGYLYFGMSGRVSQALGLGIDCSRWVEANVITHDEMLDRNWAHWNTFALDVCWALYIGREFCVAAPPPRSSIPIPFVDSEFDQMTWHHPPSGIPPQPNYLSSTFAATCNLLQVGRRIMEVVNALSNPATRHGVTSEIISKLDVELNAWKDGLSAEVDIKLSAPITATPHRLMVHLAFWWLFILLHRPFYRRARAMPGPEKDIDHVKICNQAALHIMKLLEAWRSLYSLRYVPVTLLGVVFTAGTVFLLSAVQASSSKSPSPKSLYQADLCVEYLRESGQSFQCANDIAEILRNLLQEELTSRRQDRSMMVVASRSMHHSESVEMEDSAAVSLHAQHEMDTASALNSQLPDTYFSSHQSCYLWSSLDADPPPPPHDAHDSTHVFAGGEEIQPEGVQQNDANYEMQEEDDNNNERSNDVEYHWATSASFDVSGSFQDDFDLGKAAGLSGSIHVEADNLERQLGVFPEEGDGVGLAELSDMVAWMQAYEQQHTWGNG